ncbi:MAG TPA: hypothetical protein VD929_03095 [Caulobacteraceae bacterium]|nr:hypothetical protein [Caulobacteraceae bacterium]
MAIAATLFVSKRLQKITAAFFCLTALQFVVASCTPEPSLGLYGARVPITR